MGPDQIPVERLDLDTSNPRITRAESQREALQRILDDQKTKIAVLAQDIVENGLSPMDRWLVMPLEASNRYVVLEGNRRLAAIKLLSNPTVLSDLDVSSALRKRFESIATNFDPSSVETIDCHVLADRRDAERWIQQRHTGENEGRGISAWSGLAAARFRGNGPALQALDFVLEHGHLSNSQRSSIENRFPITTLDRLLETPDVRTKIGVDIDGKTLSTALPVSAAARILRKIVLDLSDQTVNVNHLKSKKQQVDYVSSLSEYLPSIDQMSGPLRPLRSGQAHLDEEQGSQDGDSDSNTRRQRSKTPPARTRLITKDCHLTIDVPKIRRIEQELRKLPLGDYPNAISTLLRVFLELSVDHYLTTRGISLTFDNKGRDVHKKLPNKVNEALETLERVDGVPKQDLFGARTMFHSPNGPLNVETLHGYIHNKNLGALPDDLTTAFDNARPLFEAIWK